MRIHKQDWLEANIKSPIDTFKTWGFVIAQYCDPMTAQSLCPKKCWECEPRLKENIESIKPKYQGKIVGLLIWTLRKTLAQAQEELREKEPVKRDRYAGQVNPIDAFMEEINED